MHFHKWPNGKGPWHALGPLKVFLAHQVPDALVAEHEREMSVVKPHAG